MTDQTFGSPPIIGRKLNAQQWLDYVAAYPLPATCRRLVLHHTWKPTVAQWRGEASVRFLQKFYGDKGWSAGPHFFVGPDGIWLFTPMRDVGIHANSGNSGPWGYSLGLEMVGDYDRARPTGPVWELSKAVIGGVARKTGIAPRDLLAFHRDYSSKSCPGWAITKDWVIAEIEAWLNNTAPPPPPPIGPIGNPTPEVEALGELLLEEAYKARGGAQGFNNSWAFHQFAIDNSLGFPMAPSARLSVDGKEYAYQVFARETIYNEIPNWGDVRRLSELLGGSIPPAGLGRALLEATYAIGGSPFRADWAFHQFAMNVRLGPPLGPAQNMELAGKKYSFQVFALDTLYNLVPNWSDVKRMTDLFGASDAPAQQLRDRLLTATYAQAGTQYRPDWAFHQFAMRNNLGAPLGKSYSVKSGNAEYAIQIYATDLIYNVVPDWARVQRLSSLLKPRSATLSAEPEVSFAVPAPDGFFEEEEALFDFSVPSLDAPLPINVWLPSSPAISERGRSRIRVLLLHGDHGPALETITRITDFGARDSVHYYVDLNGTITQLVPEHLAAWHSGVAEWNGRRQNLNRISIGIMLERSPAGYPDAQLNALERLVELLRGRYGLPAEAVRRWNDLDPSEPETLPRFPWQLKGE